MFYVSDARFVLRFRYTIKTKDDKRTTISSMGELALIKFIRKNFPRRRFEILKGIGDDAMVFKNGMVISTDSFVEGKHFDFKYFSRFVMGYRTMAASLSDLAAMAATPTCALISLYLPRNVTKNDITQVYDGFKKIGSKYNLDISGGDIIESPFWGVTITVIGFAKKPLLRAGAKPGQSFYVTNFLGLAEVGRLVLASSFSGKKYKHAINKHLMPKPRIFEALKIKRYATAGIDTSDGLSTDSFHLSEESKVKIVIDADAIPVHPEVERFCYIKKIDPIKFILSSGEDFELLFTAGDLPKISGMKIFKIGRILKGKGIYLSAKGKLSRIRPSGYEHLR